MITVIDPAADLPRDSALLETASWKFISDLASQSLDTSVANISAQFHALITVDTVHPIAIPKSGNTSYLCSVSRFYFDAAAIEFAAADSFLLRALAGPTRAGGRLARTIGLDDVAWVGEFLLATGPAIDWSRCNIAEMTDRLVEFYPTRAICIKALNDHWHAAEIQKLKELGYLLMPTRPIWLFDSNQAGWRPPRNFKRDCRDLQKQSAWTRFEGGPLSQDDFNIIAGLEQKTFATHGTSLHPRHSGRFFEICHRSGLFLFSGLRDSDGCIVGFAMLGRGQGALAGSAWGCDPAGVDAHVLYRLLITLALMKSVELKLPLNVGFGGNRFKRVRRLVPTIEYNAYYTRHLLSARRAAWSLFVNTASAAAGIIMGHLDS